MLLARRSIRARFGRLIAIAIAILLGVSFVVGTFVLADSMRSGFNNLINASTENVDLEVRATLAFGDALEGAQRDPIPTDLLGVVESTPGVDVAEGTITQNVTIIDSGGDAVSVGGSPTFGVSWDGPNDFNPVRLLEGEAPVGADQVALDKSTADDEGFAIGDPVDIVTSTGRATYTLSGLIGLGDSDGYAGASAALWDTPTAATVLGQPDTFDVIDLRVDDGTDVATVQAALADALPDNVEVVTRDTLRDEAKDFVGSFITPFTTGLLIFAFITAFVSAFLINNVFAITIGQRLRELALLRAIGGGGRQVRRLIVSEALIVSVIATLIGIAGGLGVAKLMLGIFNAAGAGFPDMPIVLKPLAIVMAFIVGVGITLMAVVVPSRRAAKIPPVAAMRPELGFESMSSKRLVAGTTMVVIGGLAFLLGIFARPGGTAGMVALAGGGALFLFLGTASVSSTIAKPVTRLIGWPVGKVYGAPGRLARDNAGRAPRRTSATASALMIGVALVSASAVFAASIRETFKDQIDQGVTADLVVSSDNFTGLPTQVADRMSELPELSAVSGARFLNAEVAIPDHGTEQKSFAAADAASAGEVFDFGIVDGSLDDFADGILVHEDAAEDNDLSVGDTVSITFSNSTTIEVPVAGIYTQGKALFGNWVMSTEMIDANNTSEQFDFLIGAKLADGVSEEDGEAAIEAALADYPQANIESADAFRDAQAGQIDQLLVIITVLLGLSIIIAVLGISITLGLAVFERTREIGLMRAVGMTKRQTRKMVRWEAIIVSTFGAIVGIVLGTFLGVVLSLAMPDEFINGVVFNVPVIVIVLIGAVLAGLLAALYPSFKASRMDVLEAISTE